MRHSKYDSYKESGIEWLGEVPKNWTVKKIKWETAVFRGASPRPIDDPIYFDDEEGEYAWVRIADVSASGKYLLTTKQRLSDLGSSLSVKLQPNNLFLSIAGTVGKPCITGIKSCIHDGFVYFPFLKNLNQDFLYYVFLCGESYKGLGKFGTQLNLNTETVGSIHIAIPNSPEQQAIADFLDKEVSRIDTLIAKKQHFIERLKEKRLALISNSVTKGIDPKVEMKSSGVDWLEDIPNAWNVKPIKYFCTVNDETLSETSDPTAEILYVDIGSVDPTKGIVKKDLLVFEDAPSRARRIVKSGDIIVSTVRTYLRAIAPIENAEENLIVSTGFAVIRPRQIEADFLSFFLRSKYFVETVVSRSVGVSYPAINASVLASIKIASPSSKKEQKEIAEYLKKETSKMDSLIEKTELHIDKLQEYKTAFISAAVTGKIKVTDQV